MGEDIVTKIKCHVFYGPWCISDKQWSVFENTHTL